MFATMIDSRTAIESLATSLPRTEVGRQTMAMRSPRDVLSGSQRPHDRDQPFETANKIGRSADAPESLIDRLGRRQPVDKHHGSRATAQARGPAKIPSDRQHFFV
jgi:hypothetical protein